MTIQPTELEKFNDYLQIVANILANNAAFQNGKLIGDTSIYLDSNNIDKIYFNKLFFDKQTLSMIDLTVDIRDRKKLFLVNGQDSSKLTEVELARIIAKINHLIPKINKSLSSDLFLETYQQNESNISVATPIDESDMQNLKLFIHDLLEVKVDIFGVPKIDNGDNLLKFNDLMLMINYLEASLAREDEYISADCIENVLSRPICKLNINYLDSPSVERHSLYAQLKVKEDDKNISFKDLISKRFKEVLSILDKELEDSTDIEEKTDIKLASDEYSSLLSKNKEAAEFLEITNEAEKKESKSLSDLRPQNKISLRGSRRLSSGLNRQKL